MALIVQGGLAALTSGRVGNTVFARNRGGAYVRSYVKPVNPATALQGVVRDTLSLLQAAWANAAIVASSQQVAYGNYAVANPQPNRVGLTTVLPPNAMFIKMNMGRSLAGLPTVLDPPTGVPLTVPWSQTSATISGAAGAHPSVVFATGDDWVNQDDAALLIYLSPPQSLSKYFYKGKFNFAGAVFGDATTAPTSPATLSGVTLLAGRIFYRMYTTMANGQMGSVKSAYFDAA